MPPNKVVPSESQTPIENIEIPGLNNDKEADEASPEFVYKEGGWGWVVVGATAYCFAILIGMANNYALIHNQFVMVYNNTENHVFYSGWIGSLSFGLQFMGCAFGSILIDLFGPRKIGLIGAFISGVSVFSCAFVTDIRLYFLTYGALFGIGQAFLLAATLAILPHYFNKRLSLANGLMSGFSSIIIIILPIITGVLLRRYGLRETFYVLGSLNFVTVIMAASYVPILPTQPGLSLVTRLKESFGFDVFKKRDFVIWCIGGFFAIFGYMIPIVYIDHFSKERFPDFSPEILNICFAASSGVSSMISGRLGDITKFNRVHYHTVCFFIAGVAQIMLPFSGNFYVLAFLFTLLGVVDGVAVSFIVPIAYDLTKSSKLTNQASGYFHTTISPTSVAGPAIAGFLYEKTSSYNSAFFMGGAAGIFGSIILSSILVLSFLKR